MSDPEKITPQESLPAGQRAVLALGFLVILLFVLWATSGALRGGAPTVTESARRQAPDFEVPLLSGLNFNIAEHRGKTLILDFWATWCGPCEVQMPILDTLYQERGGDDFLVIGISIDTDPASKIEAWIQKREIGYPIALGSADLAQRYGAIGFPSLFLISPDGVIHTHHTGVLSRPELEEILDEIALEAESAG